MMTEKMTILNVLTVPCVPSQHQRCSKYQRK